jgi:uroporphyrinogen-III synthase
MTGGDPPMPALRGRRIVVTRTRDRAAGIVDALHQHGAEVVVVPLITTVPRASPAEIEEAASALARAPDPRWAVFSSATGARLVLNVVGKEALDGVGVAAVGPATAAAVAACGVSVDLVAPEHIAEGLASALVARGVRGATVWIPQAEGARPVLADRLAAAGAEVRVTIVYRSAMPSDAVSRLEAALSNGVDAITLTSGSTARHLARALAGRSLPSGVVIACIGPQTAREARDAGLEVDVVARDHTVAGLVEALREHFVTRQPVP